MMSILMECPFCGNVTEVEVRFEDYEKWTNGGLAQDCFPYLSASDREVLISGICPICQSGIFNSDEEEDWEEEEEDSDPELFIMDIDVGFDPYLGEYTWDC